MDSNYYYGAVARASALIAGYPDWMNVTKWPIDDDTWEEDETFG